MEKPPSGSNSCFLCGKTSGVNMKEFRWRKDPTRGAKPWRREEMVVFIQNFFRSQRREERDAFADFAGMGIRHFQSAAMRPLAGGVVGDLWSPTWKQVWGSKTVWELGCVAIVLSEFKRRTTQT